MVRRYERGIERVQFYCRNTSRERGSKTPLYTREWGIVHDSIRIIQQLRLVLLNSLLTILPIANHLKNSTRQLIYRSISIRPILQFWSALFNVAVNPCFALISVAVNPCFALFTTDVNSSKQGRLESTLRVRLNKRDKLNCFLTLLGTDYCHYPIC